MLSIATPRFTAPLTCRPIFLFALVLLVLSGHAAASPYRWSEVERVIVIGDIHGAFDEMTAVLRSAGVIDAEHQWTGGSTHLVSLGDLLDRGARSREVMDLLMALTPQARAAGGEVHVVLGNHEAMNLSRELSYVADDEMAQYSDLDPQGEGNALRGHRAAFSSEGRYGQWLLNLPLAIVINDHLMLHGGVSEDLLDYTLEQVNETGQFQLRQFVDGFNALVDGGRLNPEATFEQALAAAKRVSGDDSASRELRAAANQLVAVADGLPFSQDGPLWYRGTAMCHPYFVEPVVERALAHFGVQRIVVGHSPTADGRPHSRLDGRVLRLDTGMNRSVYGGTPTALELKEGQSRTITADGDASEWVSETHRAWQRPYAMSDAQIEAFLAEAEVTKVEELATGITNPRRLTLEQHGRKIRAVFKMFDSDNNLENQRWSRTADKSDRFVYDLLAYRLDRMLGLEMVPPAVLRTVNGQPGVAQYWVENAINEKERREKELPYQGVCSLRDQYNLMNIFDALIHNDDRNLSNVLYQQSDWKIWLIDHTRAFRSTKRLPKIYRDAEIEITPPVAEALEALTLQRLKDDLGLYLHPRQIDGLEARIRVLLRRK